MAKFKKGDRVRLIGRHQELPVGAIGTVEESGSKIPWVSFDGYTDGHTPEGCPTSSCECPHEDDLALIEAAKPATADALAVLIACGIITEAQADAARALVQS